VPIFESLLGFSKGTSKGGSYAKANTEETNPIVNRPVGRFRTGANGGCVGAESKRASAEIF